MCGERVFPEPDSVEVKVAVVTEENCMRRRSIPVVAEVETPDGGHSSEEVILAPGPVECQILD